MRQSELNHLRRLVGWVRCDIDQDPEDMVRTAQDVAAKLEGHVIDDEARRRFVERHDRARAIPKYVREAVKALAIYLNEPGEVSEAQPVVRKIADDTLPPGDMVRHLKRLRASGQGPAA